MLAPIAFRTGNNEVVGGNIELVLRLGIFVQVLKP